MNGSCLTWGSSFISGSSLISGELSGSRFTRFELGGPMRAALHAAQPYFTLPWGHGLHFAHMFFRFQWGQGVHVVQLLFCLPWGQGVHAVQLLFSFPWGQGVHATQLLFTLPWGQGSHSAQAPFRLPCEHRFSMLLTLRSRPPARRDVRSCPRRAGTSSSKFWEEPSLLLPKFGFWLKIK